MPGPPPWSRRRRLVSDGVSALSRRYRLVAQALVAAAAVAFMSPACSDDEIGNVTVLAEPTEGEAPLTVEFLARTGGEDIGFTAMYCCLDCVRVWGSIRACFA